MRINDLFEESYSALVSNKVRTGLTILGIVIGIGSVIAMVAIGQGSQKSIQASIASIGSNLLIITPGAQRNLGAGVSAGRGNFDASRCGRNQITNHASRGSFSRAIQPQAGDG
jgi:putative ABC transport system permease protein